MTVCISAFAAKSKAIVCIADRALTYAGYGADSETDSGITKIIDLPGNWCAMFSCDSLTFPKLVLNHIVKVTTGKKAICRSEMEAAAKKAYEDVWWDEVEAQILKPILLTRDDFARRPVDVQPLDQKLVLKLAEEMTDYKRLCSMIFCGFEGDSPQMFTMNTPCQLDPCDWEGFSVIGGGTESARNQLLGNEYDKDEELPSVLYDVFSAKVVTETLQGVGYSWDWRLLLPGKAPQPLPSRIDSMVDRVWIWHNRSPFATAAVRSKKEPKDWRRILSEFAAQAMKSPTPKRSTSQKSKGQR